MRPKSLSLFLVILCVSLLAGAQSTNADNPSQTAEKPQPKPPSGDFAVYNPQAEKVPTDVILVKGAVASASDSSSPLPEGGSITEKIYSNRYFGMTLPLPVNWSQKFAGPPPSDSGYYVLAQFEPGSNFKGPAPGTILVSAQDLFFGYAPVNTALEMVNGKKNRLGVDYKMEREPTEVKISGRSFYRLDYMSPVAELHWYTLTTQIRCHSLEFMLTSRDTKLLDSLVESLNKMTLTEENAPVCIKNYATAANILQKVDPVLTDRKFNPIPVRIVIDKNGKVKHIHMISSFPEQAQTITDALMQWEFKPYKKNGELFEVETGIMFGNSKLPAKTASSVSD